MYGDYHTLKTGGKVSRGHGKLEREILSLLSGKTKSRVYSSSGGGFDTRELLEELSGSGVIVNNNQKIAMYSVRRACRSLHSKGFLKGEWGIDVDFPHCKTITWSIADHETDEGAQ